MLSVNFDGIIFVFIHLISILCSRHYGTLSLNTAAIYKGESNSPTLSKSFPD